MIHQRYYFYGQSNSHLDCFAQVKYEVLNYKLLPVQPICHYCGLITNVMHEHYHCQCDQYNNIHLLLPPSHIVSLSLTDPIYPLLTFTPKEGWPLAFRGHHNCTVSLHWAPFHKNICILLRELPLSAVKQESCCGLDQC